MNLLFESPSFSISTTLKTGKRNSIGKNTPTIDGVFFRTIKEKVLGKDYELSLVFVGKDRMRALNRTHRGKDYATDILSFDLDDLGNDGCGCDHDHADADGNNHDHDNGHGHYHSKNEVFIKNAAELKYGTGEIFIHPEKARTKAKEFGRSFENYIQFLFVHGMMHLKGHDHEDDEAAEKMEKSEKHIRKAFGI